jgi:predicted regulator of Ras-like GTPase activity (Roadblock/LC7/MglB family)
MIYAGRDAVLSVIAKSGAKLGLVFLDSKRAAESIAKLL